MSTGLVSPGGARRESSSLPIPSLEEDKFRLKSQRGLSSEDGGELTGWREGACAKALPQEKAENMSQ